jgi:CHAT domain-containing protein
MAITVEGVHPMVIKLDEAGQADLDEYLYRIGGLTRNGDPPRRLIGQIGYLIESLGGILIPPEVRKFIAGKSRLALCPHRTLHLFPFHAAPWEEGDASGHLIEHFAVRYVPNLSSLLLPWNCNRTGPVLAVGVSRFDDPATTPLPNAAAEAAAVAAAHGAAGQLVVDPTRSEFMGLPLHEYRCLHLATHGSSALAGDAVDDPLDVTLSLRDGALSGWEITALRLRAELVVAAACHSGQRSISGRGLDRLPGDDIFGLQATLFEAGVQTVLGALWQVQDDTAQTILVDFHRTYAGGAAPDRALQAALRAHLADPQRQHDAFYWAPFLLTSLGSMRGGEPPLPH